MIKRTNIFFIMTVITAIFAPKVANARGGWGPFVGGAIVGSAIVGSAAASSQDRAARRDYYSQRELRDAQAMNYESRLANQRLYDENQRLRETIQNLNERMNNIESKSGKRRIEQKEKQQEEYSY